MCDLDETDRVEYLRYREASPTRVGRRAATSAPVAPFSWSPTEVAAES